MKIQKVLKIHIAFFKGCYFFGPSVQNWMTYIIYTYTRRVFPGSELIITGMDVDGLSTYYMEVPPTENIRKNKTQQGAGNKAAR